MNLRHTDLAKCHSFVVCHLSEEKKYEPVSQSKMPFITISRQAGAGGRSLGENLQTYLDRECSLPDSEWTVFDRNLVKTAMREHGLPERFAQYLPEDHVSEISSVIGELVGLHPPIWELNHHVYETLIHLANIGGVILVGRGAHVVTRKLKNGLHIRLVGGVEKRAKRAAHYYKLSQGKALEFIDHEDRARRLWVKENFSEEINDPACFDLTINTDSMSIKDAASVVGCLLKKRFPKVAKSW
jgi:cytidylate kinase